MIHTQLLDTSSRAAWDSYVGKHEHARVFHLSNWAALYDALPWTEPHYLYATRAESVCGVLPLASVRWGLTGRALVSAPYCVEAGPLTDDEAVARCLETEAIKMAQTLKTDLVEVRGAVCTPSEWTSTGRYATFERDIETDEAANLNAIPRKQRAMVRKGIKNGLRPMPISVEAFYKLYAGSMRDLGTPAYPMCLFEQILRVFADKASLLAVGDDKGIVAAVLSFYFRDTVLPYYAGSEPRARTLRGFDYLYWVLMNDAAKRGFRHFDFGRSLVGTGAYAFKKNWGFEPRFLSYSLRSISGKEPAPLDPESRFNRLARTTWARLPLSLANRLGPLISRRLY